MSAPDHGTSYATRHWQDRAACRDGHNPEQWFPITTKGGNGEDRYNRAARSALDVCAICPVVTDCLLLALDFEGNSSLDNREGIWGGTTPYERARLAKEGAT